MNEFFVKFGGSVILVATIIILIWFIRLSNKNESFFQNIPGPPTIPFFGNIFEISSTKDALDAFLKFSKMYGGIFKVSAGPIRKILIVSDYKILECILSSTKILNKSDDYWYIRSWLGTGLLTSDGPKWKKHRKILTPAFHFQILEQFIEVFESEGNKLVQKLYHKAGKTSTDIYPFITLCTLDIICESAMGTTINAQLDENSDYVRSVNAMCKISVERVFHILQMSDVTYPLTRNYYIEKKALKILHSHTMSVITKRKQELENKIKDRNQTNVGNGHARNEVNSDDTFTAKNKKAFLDLLLHATVDGRPLTPTEIREEVDTFMFEGHDTTASGISFALYCLANHTDVQNKAYEEQLSLFGENKNPEITYADLQNMKYLDLVIKETLRLYPSVPIFSRKTTETIKYNDIVIPEGVNIYIDAYSTHRNPTYFKDPEKFVPSRFETIDGKNPYSYIPFSAGPRNCIGQKFAMLEMKSTISKILRNFELQPASPVHEMQLVPEAIIKSANGIKISINHRN